MTGIEVTEGAWQEPQEGEERSAEILMPDDSYILIKFGNAEFEARGLGIDAEMVIHNVPFEIALVLFEQNVRAIREKLGLPTE